MLLTLGVLLFGSVLMLGLAVDLARVAAAWREAAHLATTAAEVGAGHIDAAAARDGSIVVDVAAGSAAAAAVASRPGSDRRVAASPDRVCVTVMVPVPPTLLAVIGAMPATVTAHACAEPRRG